MLNQRQLVSVVGGGSFPRDGGDGSEVIVIKPIQFANRRVQFVQTVADWYSLMMHSLAGAGAAAMRCIRQAFAAAPSPGAPD